MSKIAQFAKFTAKPGRGDAVIAALNDASAAASDEEGTLVYAVHVAPDNSDIVWMYELYDSVAAQQAHSGSEATARLRAALAELLDGSFDVVRGTPHQAFGLP